MTPRYAIYFAPEDQTDLAFFGACALGRLPDGSDHLDQRTLSRDREGLNSNTEFSDMRLAKKLRDSPAHYGFHATLKAPFHLVDHRCEEELLASVEAFSALQQVMSLDTLSPRRLSGFMALTLESQPESLLRLAEQCVRAFEPFRAPLTDTDLQKRHPDKLESQQRAYLFEFGYPYVLSEFRFHMTLTGSLQGCEHDEYTNWLTSLYHDIVRTAPILDRLAVFKQADRTSPFIRLEEFRFH